MPNSGPPPRAVPSGQPGGGAPPRDPAGYGNRYEEPTYGGFDTGGYENVGRRGRNDMTTELRMGGGPGASFGGGPDTSFGGASPFSPTEVGRVDQLRRTFQVRRFGSGYDTAQVDRFFDNVVASLSGRTGVIVSDNELASAHFNLVPGGYFEAEVDAAVKEVRDMVSRRR
jgi:DivIVA domain-containing protein